MMDITRNRRSKLKVDEIDFKSLVKEASVLHGRLENAHKLEITLLIEGIIPFYNDPGQLQVIFNNLISNSIKFQHPHEVKPRLDIHVAVEEKRAVITFSDNGIGIPAPELGKVFDMFYKVQGTKVEGSGLGLYVVKEITRKLKGRIYAESATGEGSRFVIELVNKIDPDLVRKLSRLIQKS